MLMRPSERLVSLAFSTARAAHRLGIQKTAPYRLVVGMIDRLLFRSSEHLPGRYIATTIDGCHFAVPRSSSFVYVHRNYEPGTRRIVREALGPGAKMVDVGANLGFLAVPAARQVGPEGHVWAIEPAPDNLSFLRYNKRLNQLDNLSIVGCAAGARNEERLLLLRDSGTLHTLNPSAEDEAVPSIPVNVRPVDSIVSDPVDLVKIDTEGAEMEVLRGMKDVLRASPKITLLIEWNRPALRDAGVDFAELPHYLTELGFHSHVIVERTAELQPVESILAAARRGDLHPRWFGNLVATRT